MSTRTQPHSSTRGDHSTRLRRIAGWALLIICAGHVAIVGWLSRDVAAGWLLGDLRGTDVPAASESLFWALPGGFTLPLIVLAGMILVFVDRGVTLPWFVPAGLTLWVVLNVFIMPMSGFVTGLVPCTLLIWADVRDRRAVRRSR